MPSLLVDDSAIIQELEADAMVKNVTKFQEYLPENFSNFDEETQEAVSQEAFVRIFPQILIYLLILECSFVIYFSRRISVKCNFSLLSD